MPAMLSFVQGYNDIARLVIRRALHWLGQLNKQLGHDVVRNEQRARGILKRYIFLELINVGVQLSRSAFVDIDKLFHIVSYVTCERFYRMDNVVANSLTELYEEFDSYQNTVGAKILLSLPGSPDFGESLVGKHTLQVCRFLDIPPDSEAGQSVMIASLNAVAATQRTSAYLEILDQVDPLDPNVQKGPERFPNWPPRS
jgi:hypothetical protein